MKLETFPHAPGTKCLPYYLWHIGAFEVHKFVRNQYFEKVEYKYKAQES